MEHKLARFLSILLHPLFVPTWFLLILYSIPQMTYSLFSPHYKLIFWAFIFMLTFVLPVLFMLVLKMTKMVKSLFMEERKQRTVPLLIVAVIYYVTFYILNKTGLQDLRVFSFFMLGSSLLILATLILNYFTKVSLHMTAWGGFAGALTGMSFLFAINLMFWLFLVLFLSGLTAYARLENKVHSPFQIYLGYLTGFSLLLVLFLFVATV